MERFSPFKQTIHDTAAQRGAYGFDQFFNGLRLRRARGQRLEYGARIAYRYTLFD